MFITKFDYSGMRTFWFNMTSTPLLVPVIYFYTIQLVTL